MKRPDMASALVMFGVVAAVATAGGMSIYEHWHLKGAQEKAITTTLASSCSRVRIYNPTLVSTDKRNVGDLAVGQYGLVTSLSDYHGKVYVNKFSLLHGASDDPTAIIKRVADGVALVCGPDSTPVITMESGDPSPYDLPVLAVESLKSPAKP